MKKFSTKYNIKNMLLPTPGEAAVLQIHDEAGDGYDEFIYLVIEYQDTNNIYGHCFRQKFVSGVGTTPIVYYGTIEQPDQDLNVLVCLDPDNLPTEYTGVTYPLTYDIYTSSFTYDGISASVINDNELDLVEGSLESGNIFVFKDKEPNFSSFNLEVYIPN